MTDRKSRAVKHAARRTLAPGTASSSATAMTGNAGGALGMDAWLFSRASQRTHRAARTGWRRDFPAAGRYLAKTAWKPQADMFAPIVPLLPSCTSDYVQTGLDALRGVHACCCIRRVKGKT